MTFEADDSRKQKRWDDRCAVTPRCSICGASVLRFGETYYEHGEAVVCEKCAPAFYDALEMAMIGRVERIKAGALRRIR